MRDGALVLRQPHYFARDGAFCAHLIQQLAHDPASVVCYDVERRELILSFCGLVRIPPEFFVQLALVLPDLRSLDLMDNNLQELPNTINHLQNLRILVLSNNLLRDLPGSLCSLEHLTYLFLGNNLFRSLSSVHLPHLRVLDMSANRIREMRTEDAISLTHLQKLFIGGNNLHSISAAIVNMPALEYLCLYGNPDHILESSVVTTLQNRGVTVDRYL